MMMTKWELRLRTLPAGHHPRLSLLQTSPKCWRSSSPWSLSDGFDHNNNHIMGKILSSTLMYIYAIESHSQTHNCNWTIWAQAATLECSLRGHRPHSSQVQIRIHTSSVHLQTQRQKHRSTDKAPEKPINSCWQRSNLKLNDNLGPLCDFSTSFRPSGSQQSTLAGLIPLNAMLGL